MLINYGYDTPWLAIVTYSLYNQIAGNIVLCPFFLNQDELEVEYYTIHECMFYILEVMCFAKMK